MENKQLSQQRSAGESRRSEYKSPILRKLGKLTHMTLAVGVMGDSDGGAQNMDKTG